MMDCSKLFEHIDSGTEAYLAFLSDIVLLESPTDDKKGVDAVGRYFIDKAKEKGWKTEVFKEDTAGDFIVITMNADAPGRPVCLSGHMDTVHPVGFFGSQPVRREGEKMFGPGVADCKGGCVCAFWVMEALCDMGYRSRPVKLLLQSDEETSSLESDKRTVGYMLEEAKGAAAFINLEPTTTGGVTLKRRGIAKFAFTVSGVSEHASKGYLGASAIAAAAHKILALEAYKDKDGITLNCGTIKGGTATNTVPAACNFTLDSRFADSDQYEQVKAIVRTVAQREDIPNTSCHVQEISYRAPMPATKANRALFERINDILEESGLPRVVNIDATGGSDAAYTTLAGIPTADSFGPAGGGLHTAGEYIKIDEFSLAAKRLAAILLNLKGD